MKILKPLKIDMEVFLKTGKFDYLEIGQTQSWILENFPDPDDWSAKSKTYKGADIWKYGDIELHFSDGKLSMIFSDHFSDQPLQGGQSLKIEPWIICNKLALKEFFFLQLTEKFNFYVDTNKFDLDEHHIIVTLDSGVNLAFSGLPSDDIFDCKLSSFSFHGTNKN